MLYGEWGPLRYTETGIRALGREGTESTRPSPSVIDADDLTTRDILDVLLKN